MSSEKLFSFSRYSNFCNFFSSFPHFPDSKRQMEAKNTSKKFLKNRRKTTVCLKYFGQDCLCKQHFASNLPPGPFKFDFFNNFGNSKDFNTVLT